MNVFITGGAGYIGSQTARLLARNGHTVTAYDNLSTGHAEALSGSGVNLVCGDVLELIPLTKALRDSNAEVVMNFAALTYVGESVNIPLQYYHDNIVGIITLLRAMTAADVNRLIHSSSCAVYGSPKGMYFSEESPLQPSSPYGRSKLAVENIIRDYAASPTSHPIQYTIFRYFNVAGADPVGRHGEDHTPETHLVPLALKAAVEETPYIKIHGEDYPSEDGTCLRDYVHVADVANAHSLALDSHADGCFNLGSGCCYSVLEVVNLCQYLTGRKIPVKVFPRRPGDAAKVVAIISEAQNRLGWKPRFNMNDIITSAWKWHTEYPRGYATPE